MANRKQLQVIGAARSGEPAAQLALGRHYLFGEDGLQQNFSTALHWLDRAARQHIDDAWMLIGRHIPFAIAQRAGNMRQLAIWYEKAFDAGEMQAGLVFAQIVQGLDGSAITPALRSKAMHALRAAAQAGIAEAQWMLAQQQEHCAPENAAASQPPEGNVAISMEWAISAAEGGIVAARYALAEHTWATADYKAFLHWSLPLARDLTRRAAATSY
ncbi:MAG TPA: SEL1-like repeat protein [Noviherbaspirillum sp.]|nr:SEL1-like repeat protein [Noviherbaspirillum sp.]